MTVKFTLPTKMVTALNEMFNLDDVKIKVVDNALIDMIAMGVDDQPTARMHEAV